MNKSNKKNNKNNILRCDKIFVKNRRITIKNNLNYFIVYLSKFIQSNSKQLPEPN